jgi:hypothetical protein
MFLTPDRLMIGGDPQADQHEQDGDQLVLALVDEHLDVQHPADGDPRVAGPRVIQYDHALKKPTTLPNAARE